MSNLVRLDDWRPKRIPVSPKQTRKQTNRYSWAGVLILAATVGVTFYLFNEMGKIFAILAAQ